ncbi:MAG: VWA domain-containing protein [Clostridia bacterium]|nr:VWA domain-containing protein [Clostridia bacterium]
MAKKFTKVLCALLAFVMCLGTVPFAYANGIELASIGANSINKVASNLDDDFVDVTLSVPGKDIDLSSDIVFIVGAGPANNYNYIVEMIHKMLVAVDGTPTKIKIGMVSFANTTEEETVLNLTEMIDTVPGNKVADYRFSGSSAEYEAKLADWIAETPELENDMEFIIAKALERAETVYDGVNLESSLITARDMLAADTTVPADRKHMIVISTGLAYWFDNDAGEPSTIAGTHADNGKYMTGNKYWLYARNKHGNTSNGYVIPTAFHVKDENKNVVYTASWNNYWSYIESWIAADQNNYVFTPYEKNYGDFAISNVTGKESKPWGYAISTAKNIEIAKSVVVPKFTGGANPLTTPAAAHALNYERGQYEALMVYRQMETPIGESVTTLLKDKNGNNITLDGLGFNCYAIAIGKTPEPGSETTWLESNQIGYNFMCMMGGENTVNYNEADLSFFDSIENKILFTCAAGSYVEDYIGYNRPDQGNFEFVTDPATISMVRGDVTYKAEQIDTKEGATASYKLVADGEKDFLLDYYRGNGKDTERFIWTFGDYASLEKITALTYKLKLIDKSKEAGTYTVDTNLSATLYPKDSDGKFGTPVPFPVPNVTYEVKPYDVDIVLALGAGIAKYDADHTYKNTYNSIVSLVEPLVTAGINVKLGLIAVEHYDDVAMELTELTSSNYTDIIQAGLEAIQKMPAGPTNLHGNIVAAHEMLENDTSVPDANKFFYVFATGRTYNYDNEKGIPTTIVNKLDHNGNSYYYWGHYLWQSQRGRHTSLYMIPDRYNNNFESYWADVEKWVAADGDTYAYSFTNAYDADNPQWFNNFMADNSTDLRAHGIAGSRYGWLLKDLTNSGIAAIGSGNNPQNALNYERAQYEAYQEYVEMAELYNCYAFCTESPAYQNGSEYIKRGAGYTGTSTIQLGHSFMDFLAKADGQEYAPVLFTYVFDENNNPIATDFETPVYFETIDATKLETSGEALGSSTLSLRNSAAKNAVASVSVDAEGDALTYKWYYKNQGSDEFTLSSFTGADFRAVMSSDYDGMQVYCVITDQYNNSTTTEVVTLNLD